MRSKLLNTIAVAGVSLGFIQGASGTIMGLYNFDGTGDPESFPAPNYFAPGFSGGVVKGMESRDVGGSNDGTLGGVAFADGRFENPPVGGDGMLRIGVEPFPGNPFPQTEGPAIIRLSNSSGMPLQLSSYSLVYDAAADSTAQSVEIWYSFNHLDAYTLFHSSGSNITQILPTDVYADYWEKPGGATLAGLPMLADGATVYFKFAMAPGGGGQNNTGRIDNIGLIPTPSAVPESGAWLTNAVFLLAVGGVGWWQRRRGHRGQAVDGECR